MFADVADIASYIADYDLMALADNLWMSFQDSIQEFVELNGGSASLPEKRNQGKRPDWESVQRFLNGQLSIEELRSDCHD